MGIKKYPLFSFIRKTVRESKIKYQKNFESQEGEELFTVSRQGRPSIVSDELVTEIKAILHNLRISGGVISWKTVIAIGNGVLNSRYPEKLTKNGESVTLTSKWARGVLKSKRRGTTAKREMNPSFTWKRKIANAIFEHSIHNEMILNYDQSPLGFIYCAQQSNQCSVRADCHVDHCVKSVHIQCCSDPYFPTLGPNMDRYRVSLPI